MSWHDYEDYDDDERSGQKDCEYCGETFDWVQIDGAWIPWDRETNERHDCRKTATLTTRSSKV